MSTGIHPQPSNPIRPGDKIGTTTVDAAEIARFSALAAEWWNPNGKFGVLHKFNPVRLGFIRDEAAKHFSREVRDARPFAGLRLLDIGCGGGLLSEPMARLGFEYTGIGRQDRVR